MRASLPGFGRKARPKRSTQLEVGLCDYGKNHNHDYFGATREHYQTITGKLKTGSETRPDTKM